MTTTSAPPRQLTRGHIVQLVQAERPSWAPRGIEAAVGRGLERYPAEVVLRAGLSAARDSSARTPAVIPVRCEHEAELMASGVRPGVAPAARATSAPLPPEHCGRSSCVCDHSECDAGWLAELVDQASGEVSRLEDATRPCPNCRPGLAARAAEAREWQAARTRRLAALAATSSPATRRELLDGVRAELGARRARRTTTTATTTTEELTA